MTDDPVRDDLFDEDIEALAKSKKMSGAARAELVMAMDDLMQTEAGRKVLWWLLGETKIYKLSFTGNSLTYFNEGTRAVGLKVLDLILEARPLGLQELMNARRGNEEQTDGC